MRDEIHAEVCDNGFDADAQHLPSGLRRRRRSMRACCCWRRSASSQPDDPRYRRHDRGDRARAARRRLRAALQHARDRRRPAARRRRLPRLQLLAGRRLRLGRPRRTTPTQLFERLLAIRNDLGLLAEEYDTASGRLIGNFPQAFSHVGLINTAFNLTRAAPTRRAARQGQRRRTSRRRASPRRRSDPATATKSPSRAATDVRRRAPSSEAR